MIVMKFGGTSVKDAEAVRRVVQVVGRERRPRLVVVSALSKVTDALLEVARLAEQGDGTAARQAVKALHRRHEEMAALVRATERRASLLAVIDALFEELEGIVRALAVVEEVSPRSRDAIVAFGELASSRLVAAAIEDAGLPSRWLDARAVLVTDAQHGAALPDREATDERLRSSVPSLLAEGLVPVVGGFVGATPAGLTTTLGRGGSDFSAALFGAGLRAEEIQIWTDVDGMLTADPRVVAAPRVVPQISFDEASELAYFGAKVLHPASIRPAVERGIPVVVLNSFNPQARGTRITRSALHAVGEPRAFAFKKGITVLIVSQPRMLMAHGFLARIFEAFNRHRTPVDLIATSEVSVSLTVDDPSRLDAVRAELAELGEVQQLGGMAIVSVVGRGFTQRPGLAARVFDALRDVNILMISFGASDVNVSFVVTLTAVRAAWVMSMLISNSSPASSRLSALPVITVVV